MSRPSRKLSSRWPSRSSDTRTVRAPGAAAEGAGSVIPWGLSDTLATRDKVLISQGVAPVLGVIASAAVQGQKPDLRFRSATSHCPRGSHVSSVGPAEPALALRVIPVEVNTSRATQTAPAARCRRPPRATFASPARNLECNNKRSRGMPWCRSAGNLRFRRRARCSPLCRTQRRDGGTEFQRRKRHGVPRACLRVG